MHADLEQKPVSGPACGRGYGDGLVLAKKRRGMIVSAVGFWGHSNIEESVRSSRCTHSLGVNIHIDINSLQSPDGSALRK